MTLKFTTIDKDTYYLRDSVIYGFRVYPEVKGYMLRLLDTTESGYYDLGIFENKDICDSIIYNIEMCVVTGIIDVDRIIELEVKNYKRGC